MAEKPTYEELLQRIKELEQEKLESNAIKENMDHGEGRPTYKIKSRINPEIQISEIDFDAVINAEEIRKQVQKFCRTFADRHLSDPRWCFKAVFRSRIA